MTAHAALALVVLWVAGCSTGGATPRLPPASAAPSPTAPGNDGPAPTPPAGIDIPQEILERVVADAARRARVMPTQVVIEHAAAVTWPDGALGCPEPGMVYIQVLVDGYRVVLRAADEPFDYRIGGDGTFKLCPSGQDAPVPEPVGPQPTIEIPPPIYAPPERL